MPGDSFLTLVNADPRAAAAELMSCCASRRWAAELVARAPFADLDRLEAASSEIIAALDWADVREAADAHPRIGERVVGEGREAGWSREEQSAAADDRRRADLVEGNLRYEERFGHVFLICATGLPADAVLAALRGRLGNDETAERKVVRHELAKIVELRLRKQAAA